MRLYQYELAEWIEFLYRLRLVDKASRMRSRMIRLLSGYMERLQGEYDELVQEHARKDEQGRPITEETEGQSKLVLANPEAFQQAYRRLLEEEIVLDQTAERKEMLLAVREAVLNCGLSFEGDEAVRYDRWCEIVEGIDIGQGEEAGGGGAEHG
ncbi:hypothetical protein [Paenibacillus sp. SYP-B4298]|uniref:hypothetical protein n=1 Tax=Paenibacillus sp. SYP-B4298 TaxID=2996034 RepID=UPI0022DD1BF5|nr:hypothetical protein [Paenibacillus sp. SYP-B4298]